MPYKFLYSKNKVPSSWQQKIENVYMTTLRRYLRDVNMWFHNTVFYPTVVHMAHLVMMFMYFEADASCPEWTKCAVLEKWWVREKTCVGKLTGPLMCVAACDGNYCKECDCFVPEFTMYVKLCCINEHRGFNVDRSQFTNVIIGERLNLSAKADLMDVDGCLRG